MAEFDDVRARISVTRGDPYYDFINEVSKSSADIRKRMAYLMALGFSLHSMSQNGVPLPLERSAPVVPAPAGSSMPETTLPTESAAKLNFDTSFIQED